MAVKKILWILLVLLACAGLGFGSYSIGLDRAQKKAAAELEQTAALNREKLEEAEALNRAERELNIALNRAELETLRFVDGPIYVFGHKSPDSDTVCTSIVYARILQQLGYDARPAVQGKINSETDYILKMAGVEVPEQLLDAAGKNVVLIDHSESIQSSNGIQDANIISIIDHHNAGSISSSSPLIYDARPIGSAATIAWIRARNYGVEVDASMAALLFGAMMSDTSNLKSAATTSADRAAYEELPKIAGIEDPETFYREMFKASLSYEGMPDTEILNSDIRDYEAGGRSFSIGCMNAYDEPTAMDLAKRMKVLLPELCIERGVEMSYAQISIFHDDISICYIVPSDETAAEVLEAAFPDGGYVFDGVSYVFNPGMSRRQVLVPAITDVLAAHPGE